MKFIYFNQKYLSDRVSYEADGRAILIPEPWLIYKNPVGRFLCHVFLSPKYNSKLYIPGKELWIRDILKKTFKRTENVCIIINAHFYHLYYGNIMCLAKEYFHSVKFVFIFSDRVEYFQKHYKDFPNIESLKSDFNAVLTYNSADSTTYGITLDRPCFPTYREEDKIGEYHSDIFFVGYEKGRLEQLYEVFEICKKHGLMCDFYISGVEEERQKYKNEIHFNQPMPYSEVLKRSRKTKCILNIIQNGGSGITLRDYETLAFNKLELTNNIALKITGLYTAEQIIWIDELEYRIEDIKRGYQGNNTFATDYSQNNWFIWLEELLK